MAVKEKEEERGFPTVSRFVRYAAACGGAWKVPLCVGFACTAKMTPSRPFLYTSAAVQITGESLCLAALMLC